MFFLSMYFFRNIHYFMFLFLFFVFFNLNSFCWGGLFYFFDSYSYLSLVFMGLYILSIIILSEGNKIMIYLTQSVIIISFFFFCSSNILHLYLFFELSMFPILIMIMGYGYQIEKINSFFYLVFYASFCSFPFLFLYFILDFSFGICYLDFVVSWEVAFIISMVFMVKFPVFFLHLWLPKAHVEAPTTASMLLAGLLLKLGTLGFIRILKIMMFCHYNYWVLISFLGMILSAFTCIFQSDVKSMAAYSSICHMSFLLFSMIMLSLSGKSSSLLLMISHGFTSSLMFFFIGKFYDSSGTRMIYYWNSFMNSSILFSILFSFCMFSNMGVPFSLSFFSEFMTFTSGLLVMKGFFFIGLIYFFISFYYSIFLVVSSFMGKSFIDFKLNCCYFSFFLIFMCYNVFWFCFIF